MKTGDAIQCAVPLSPLRTEPRDSSEMCTQALAGELAMIVSMGERDWIEIQLVADEYRGWTDKKQWSRSPRTEQSFLIQAPVSSWLRQDGARVQFVAGSRLSQGTSGEWHVGEWAVEPLDALDSVFGARATALDVAREWIGAPYAWGGKSVFGVDCSGLVQVAFALSGLQVPRDASMQVSFGEEVAFESRQEGDLAFFVNAAGKVIHVGMLNGPDQILHAAGEVRIDAFDREGIKRNGQLTHTFSQLRRWDLTK